MGDEDQYRIEEILFRSRCGGIERYRFSRPTGTFPTPPSLRLIAQSENRLSVDLLMCMVNARDLASRLHGVGQPSKRVLYVGEEKRQLSFLVIDVVDGLEYVLPIHSLEEFSQYLGKTDLPWVLASQAQSL